MLTKSHKIKAPASVVASCLAVFLPGALTFGFPGVMGEYWQQTFGVGQSDIGRILFFVLSGAGIFMFVIGRFQEKTGPAVAMALGAILHGLAVISVGHAGGIRAVYLWAFMTGASSAFIYLPALTVAQLWYPARRGLVSGLVSMFFGISGAVMAPVFSTMLLRLGCGRMTLILGIGFLALGLLSAAFVRVPKRPGATVDENAVPWPQGTLSVNLRQTLSTRSFRLLWVVFAAVGAAGISMVTLSVNFGLTMGLGMGEAVFILTAFNLTNGLSRLVSGYLSDILGRKEIMAAAFLCAGISYYLFPFLSGPVMWAVLAAVIGFAFGTLFAVTPPLIGECFGMVHFGSIFGMIFTAFGFFSGALGPWLSGLILDLSGGNFTLVFSYLGSLMTGSALLIWITGPRAECVF